jgi:hypothetical protein
MGGAGTVSCSRASSLFRRLVSALNSANRSGLMKSLNGRGGPGLALVDRRFWHIRHLTREASMTYETLCNPVPAADVPVNFYRDPR